MAEENNKTQHLKLFELKKKRIPWNKGKSKGWYIDRQGYKLIIAKSEHFERFKHLIRDDGQILEHRLVWEESRNCCLLEWSHVHHLNGIKDDNRPENLEAMMAWHHLELHNNLELHRQKTKTREGSHLHDITHKSP